MSFNIFYRVLPRNEKQKMALLVLFVVGLVYMVLPGPLSIDDFSPLPQSIKSNLEGDTIQNPNIAAYFSDFRRSEITSFYRNELSRKLFLGIKLPIIKLNHPPELAYKYVRDQQESTFLEEYLFPIRESLFVNGYEPYIENEIYKKQHSEIGDRVYYRDVLAGTGEDGMFFNSKTTLRFYPSPLIWRIVVYLGIWGSSLLLFSLFNKIKQEAV